MAYEGRICLSGRQFSTNYPIEEKLHKNIQEGRHLRPIANLMDYLYSFIALLVGNFTEKSRGITYEGRGCLNGQNLFLA